MALAEPPAGQDDPVSRREIRRCRLLHRAGKIYAGHMGIVPHQPRQPLQDQAVLVVEVRIIDADGDVALGQPVFVKVGHGAGNIAVVFFEQDGAESHAGLTGL